MALHVAAAENMSRKLLASLDLLNLINLNEINALRQVQNVAQHTASRSIFGQLAATRIFKFRSRTQRPQRPVGSLTSRRRTIIATLQVDPSSGNN